MKALAIATTLCTLFITATPSLAIERSEQMRGFTVRVQSGSAEQNLEVIPYQREGEIVYLAFEKGDSDMIASSGCTTPIEAGKIICSGSRTQMPDLLATVISKWLCGGQM